eukprot:SAG11_NODE_3337_length_2516_cov_2.095987_2_plen_118_part_00
MFAKSTTVQELDYIQADGTTLYKDVNYITFLTDAVGGIQSKILLPVTCGILPPTGAGSDGSSFAGNLMLYKSIYPFSRPGTYPSTSQIRFCGMDPHFSAYGNRMQLFCGRAMCEMGQ